MSHKNIEVIALSNGQLGTISIKQFKKGDIIYTLKGEISNIRTRESVQISPNTHIFDQEAQYINHSYTPNIIIKDQHIVALSTIEKNEEIRFDYTLNESEISSPFTCDQTGRDVNTHTCIERQKRVEFA